MSGNKGIRINKFLSEAGFCSRREADKLIEKNRVKINGEVPLIGTKVTQGDRVSVDKKITVYVKPASEQSLLELLVGSSSKTWKINAAQDAHFSNGDPEKKYSTYWEAPAFSKLNSGFYDDEYIFEIDGTYKHKTNNSVFGKAGHLTNDFGSSSKSPNSAGEIENYILDDYQTTFVAKKDNGENKLEINGKGFIGFYVGQQKFTIECYDSENIYLRVMDEAENVAWYVWLTSKEVSETNPKDQFKNYNE